MNIGVISGSLAGVTAIMVAVGLYVVFEHTDTEGPNLISWMFCIYALAVQLQLGQKADRE